VAELVKGCNNKKRDTTFFNYQPVPYLDVVKDLNVSCDGLKLGYEAYLEDASTSYWLLNNEQIEGDFLETTLPFGGPKNASLVGFNEGCADTLNLDLNEFNIDSLIKSYLPNVFTPNNDGKNDFFGKELKEIFPCATIEIFSRWGNPVFSNKFTEKPWNGKINNNRELVRPGTYFYVINFYEYSYKGSLTVNY
jgi:gliding motility-associated-like protein